ncbi:MAG: hypothetical protein FRX49_11548 [Trebouxia sp. A1-2]|nr:MAG: hypothetical protein FRX49_11548 [Trebouxia sp. A1-2]
MYKSVHAPNLGRAGPNLLSYPLPLKVRHLSLPAQTSSRIRGRASTPTACEEKGGQEGTPNVALALAVAPLLIPLKALCQEQSTIADLSSASPEIVSLVSSTLAIPVVIFGAVSLIQQAKQANEDKALRLKAINTHNSFLSQEEDKLIEPHVHSAASLVLNSNGAPDSSTSTSQSSADEPDTAAPAMLDQPDRPEPGMPKPSHSSSADESSQDKSSSNLPPQTAVLDRPERPEPDSASLDSDAAAQNDMTTQQTEPAFSSFMATLQAEYEAKMKSLKGSQETARPLTRPQKSRDQAEDMAAEYAAKLAMLHEESAARAEGDLRKKQKRYAMLADLQSQAQMSRTPSPREVQSSQQRDSKDINLLAGMWARLVAFLQRLVASVRNIVGMGRQQADMHDSTQCGST